MKNFVIYVNKHSIILTLFLLLILFNCSDKNPFPEVLGNISLSKVISGDEAKSFVNRLHFSSVTNEKNEIAFYGKGKGEIIIYITYYDSEDKAKTNFEKMTKKISPDNSVFIKGSFYKLHGINIYKCYGMGQTHFVFFLGKNLYWLSVPTMGHKKILKEYLYHIH